MYCSKCGAENREGNVFCSSCGERLVKEPANESNSGKQAPASFTGATAGLFSIDLTAVKRGEKSAILHLIMLLSMVTHLLMTLGFLFGGVTVLGQSLSFMEAADYIQKEYIAVMSLLVILTATGIAFGHRFLPITQQNVRIALIVLNLIIFLGMLMFQNWLKSEAYGLVQLSTGGTLVMVLSLLNSGMAGCACWVETKN